MSRSKKKSKASPPMERTPGPSSAPERLYQEVARTLMDRLVAGKYAVGERLPAERELCAELGVSRPTVREAVIALEVIGLIEVRIGAGAYVKKLPGADQTPGFNITAFELTEARLLIEGEAAALAAQHITEAELNELDRIVTQMSRENVREPVSEHADHAFHNVIASATRNAAIVKTVEDLWRLRATSPACAVLYQKARTARVRPVLEEHRRIVAALRSRDPAKARNAMRDHLAAVMDHLLFATEAMAIEQARAAAADARKRVTKLAAS